jgi:hypothetical protein
MTPKKDRSRLNVAVYRHTHGIARTLAREWDLSIIEIYEQALAILAEQLKESAHHADIPGAVSGVGTIGD